MHHQYDHLFVFKIYEQFILFYYFIF